MVEMMLQSGNKVKTSNGEFPFIINAIQAHIRKEEGTKEVYKDIKFLEFMKGNEFHFKDTNF